MTAKTLIGVLASHDSQAKNESLRGILENADPDVLSNFGFVFTGGTFDRLFRGEKVLDQRGPVKHMLSPERAEFLKRKCEVICLPPTSRGGVIILSSLVTSRRVSILWPFFTPLTTHLLFPENLALLRLADQWHAKKLMNSGSVEEWLDEEAARDVRRNIQPMDIDLDLPGSGLRAHAEHNHEIGCRWLGPEEREPKTTHREDRNRELKNTVVALISHDEMKNRMLDFVVDHEAELSRFGKILATGTTGSLVRDAAPSLANKVHRYHSGPKGGDVEIATEILYGGCHVVIFFVDPLHPHPHAEDIRVVFGACMIQDRVRMLSNEGQARDWIDRVVRGR